MSPKLVSCADAKGVPPVPMQNIHLATDDVTGPPLSTRTLTSAAAAEGVPYVRIQKGPVGSDDASSMASSIKVAD